MDKFPKLKIKNMKNKVDALLLVFLALSLFLWDVSMNKVTDLGMDYKAYITQTVNLPMILMMWIGGLGVAITLGWLIIRAVTNRKGSVVWDTIAGIVGFVSFAFLILGGLLQVLKIEAFPLFLWQIYTITAYHWIAIAGLVLVMIYFALTE